MEIKRGKLKVNNYEIDFIRVEGTFKRKLLECVDCGGYYSPKELTNGKCPIHQKEPELVEIEEPLSFRLFEIPKKLYIEQGFSLPETEKKFSLIRLDKLFYPSPHFVLPSHPLADLGIKNQKPIDYFAGGFNEFFKAELQNIKTKFPQKDKETQDLMATLMTIWNVSSQSPKWVSQKIEEIEKRLGKKYQDEDKKVGEKFRELLKKHITSQELFFLEQLYLPSKLFGGRIFWQDVSRLENLYPFASINGIGVGLLLLSLKGRNEKCNKVAEEMEKIFPNLFYPALLVILDFSRDMRKKDDSERKKEERKPKTLPLNKLIQKGSEQYRAVDYSAFQQWQKQIRQLEVDDWEKIEKSRNEKIITERQYKVLELMRENLSQKEIAKQLGKTPSTISELYTKAIERLRNYFNL